MACCRPAPCAGPRKLPIGMNTPLELTCEQHNKGLDLPPRGCDRLCYGALEKHGGCVRHTSNDRRSSQRSQQA